jgi:hypothetical protein
MDAPSNKAIAAIVENSKQRFIFTDSWSMMAESSVTASKAALIIQ